MGDTGDAFKAYNEIKSQERMSKEPNRIKYAMSRLHSASLAHELDNDHIIIKLSNGNVVLWPYTGWFCGQKPLGKIKGRGIDKLIKCIKEIQ